MIPEPVTIPPTYSHVHRWQLRVRGGYLSPLYDEEPEITAVCVVPECGAWLTKEEAEARLNSNIMFSGYFTIDESENE